MTDFANTVLLSLKRKYTENEAFQLALQELNTQRVENKKLGFENGVLKSEIAELNHTICQFEVERKEHKAMQAKYQKLLKKYNEQTTELFNLKK
jgi:hypothetical protein